MLVSLIGIASAAARRTYEHSSVDRDLDFDHAGYVRLLSAYLNNLGVRAVENREAEWSSCNPLTSINLAYMFAALDGLVTTTLKYFA
jgi:hypothetical protein